jgi:hypothetical protein
MAAEAARLGSPKSCNHTSASPQIKQGGGPNIFVTGDPMTYFAGQPFAGKSWKRDMTNWATGFVI